jgi:hypothetical protein
VDIQLEFEFVDDFFDSNGNDVMEYLFDVPFIVEWEEVQNTVICKNGVREFSSYGGRLEWISQFREMVVKFSMWGRFGEL